MGKMDDLSQVAAELQNAAQALVRAAETLIDLFPGGGIVSVAAEEKPLTLEAVRAVLAEKSRLGHTAEVRALLEKHGAARLSEIDPVKYPVLLADAKVLGNG